MNMNITAIFIDGPKIGETWYTKYSPALRFIKTKPLAVMHSYADKGKSYGTPEEMIYKECFRSVDQKYVLYSLNGLGDDISVVLELLNAVKTQNQYS